MIAVAVSRLIIGSIESDHARKRACMNFEDLTPEQLARIRDCKTPEDLLAFAKSEFVELDNEQIESIAGGGWGGSGDRSSCPECGSKTIDKDPAGWQCLDCGHCWV